MPNSKDLAVEFARSKGFDHWATLGGKELQFMDECGINLFIDPEKKTFRFAYLIPNSIFQLICPDCSPFYNEEHFNKIYRKFKKEVVECWSFDAN